MLEMKEESVDSLIGSISMMGGSVFQSPTIFGTMAALAAKIEDMDKAAPPSSGLLSYYLRSGKVQV
jgi:hypothetical protein